MAMESQFYVWLLRVWLALTAGVFATLWFVVAPYGRHARRQGWGPTIDHRLGWLLMEVPAPLVFGTA